MEILAAIRRRERLATLASRSPGYAMSGGGEERSGLFAFWVRKLSAGCRHLILITSLQPIAPEEIE